MILEERKLIEVGERYRATRPAARAEAVADATGRRPSPANLDSPERLRKRVARLQRNCRLHPETTLNSLAEIMGVSEGATRMHPELPVIGLERTIGNRDYLAVGFLASGVAVARAVARVQLLTGSGVTLGFGTGFLISRRLLMTNHHVFRTPDSARHSRVEFNYEALINGGTSASTAFKLLPDEFWLTIPELDFSVVAVATKSVNGDSLDDFGCIPLIEQEGKILIGESMNIIQHPSGEVKQIAIRNNHLVDLPQARGAENFLFYESDTEPGSSGSPVFNDQWELVGLHHSGVPLIQNGKIIAKNGQPWQSSMGEENVKWIANEGIRVSKIVRTARSVVERSPQLRDLWEDAMAMSQESSNLPLPPRPRPEESRGVNTPASGTGASSVNVGGAVQLTVPLVVTVQLGGATQRFMTNSTTDNAAVHPIPNRGDPTRDSTKPSPFDADHQMAIRAVEDSTNRPYYLEDADKQDRAAYYQNINTANSVSPADFYNQLSQLVETTHANARSYKPAVHVYPWVDLQPNRRLRSVYSLKEYDPLQLIEADFIIDERRREMLGTQEMSPTTIDMLEETLKYNCEHVVPQSWFNKREPMRGDLHHLFACESGCNSFRGNIPYFDFEDFDASEVIREACGKRDLNRFEPTNVAKGTVARATLYFLLRYPGEINRTANEYQAERLKILLDWHKANRPQQYEFHRNQAIFAAQGNRNPLIDHPEWADRIDFKQGLGN
jgi:endonuclease I/V8-like Glu-specific endopeptidase